MPVHTDRIGNRAAIDVDCDGRWLMAFAAAVKATATPYFDTVGGVIAHPMFPVAPEWALLTGSADPFGLALERAEQARAVHAAHDVILHRPIRAGDHVQLSGELVGARRTTAGSLTTIRFDARTPDGEPVWTTWMDNLHRGVEVVGSDVVADRPAIAGEDPSDSGSATIGPIPIGAGDAHIYTECARIWNPIHTDVALALRAGLPSIILHGTATIAIAVTELIDRRGESPGAVRRISGSFRAMVPLPSELTVTARDTGAATRFEVHGGSGTAVRDGLVEFDTGTDHQRSQRGVS